MIIKIFFLLSICTSLCVVASYVKIIEDIQCPIVGNVKSVVFRSSDNGNLKNLIPVIAIHGASPSLKYEFMKVSEVLAQNGFMMILPDLHSNENTRPGNLKDIDIINNVITKGIIDKYLQGRKPILMGKSWGGQWSAQLVIANPNRFLSLVLIAPAINPNSDVISLLGRSKNLRVLLLFNEDDQVMISGEKNIPNSMKNNDYLNKQLTIYSNKHGGHRIVDTFIEPIMEFMSK